MARRGAWIVMIAALAAVLFASVSTSGGVGMWGEPQWDPTPVESDRRLENRPTPTPPSPVVDEADASGSELPAWVETMLRALLVVVAVVSLVLLVAAGWTHRPRVRWRRRSRRFADFDALPDVAGAVVDRAGQQRTALLTGAPRNAIVRCWLQLERDVATAGLHRHPADTSAEFTERVLSQYGVDSDAIHALAALYREARFSRHRLDEPARQAALDALDRLHRSLREAVESADATAADTSAGSTSGMRA